MEKGKENKPKKTTEKRGTHAAVKKSLPAILTEAQLLKIVDNVQEDRKSLAQSAAKELLFMAKMLNMLKEKALEIGPTEDFRNGSQEMLRENVALKSYNVTIKNYALMLQRLADLLPKVQAQIDDERDDLDDFITGRDAE